MAEAPDQRSYVLDVLARTVRPLRQTAGQVEALRGERSFSGGLLAAGSDAYYAVFALNKAGIGRVHARAEEVLWPHLQAGVLGEREPAAALLDGLRAAIPELRAIGRIGKVRLRQPRRLHRIVCLIFHFPGPRYAGGIDRPPQPARLHSHAHA